MNETDERLEEETRKWLENLEERVEKADSSVEQMENVEAYRRDTRHFLQEKDYVRAFESVIYAWGIFETLERLGKIEE